MQPSNGSVSAVQAVSAPPQAPVMEVFSSVQGEGRYAGELQVFLRLRGCPLRCRYCDTPGSWELNSDDALAPRARVESTAAVGERHVSREETWASPFRAVCWIHDAERAVPRTVSVTGGEPLLWPAFIRELKLLLGDRRLHLETAGAHVDALREVLDRVDHVSLDLKLATDLDEPQGLSGFDRGKSTLPRTAAEWAAVRAATLPLLADRDACAKLVVTGEGSEHDYGELLDDVSQYAPELPVYIHPATPMGGASAPAFASLEAVAERALELGLRARVLPQLHRVLRVP